MALQMGDFTSGLEQDLKHLQNHYHIENGSKLLVKGDQQTVAFVDVVMEGGGVKGITSAGAIHALEQMGFRFRKIAGTSAGAIAAALLSAAGKNALYPKSEIITRILTNLDFYSFVDGGGDARALLSSYNDPKSGSFFGKFFQTAKKGISAIRNINDLINDLGINPGNEFKAFITSKLASLNSDEPYTIAALQSKNNSHLTEIKKSWHISNEYPVEKYAGEFQIVTSDISNRRKAVFPRDAKMYFKNPDEILIGEFVRASMSIPIFFEPFNLYDFTTTADNFNMPDHITFVDGGVVSNFPLSLFDVGGQPSCPTFGLLIDETRDETVAPNKVDNLFELGMAMFDTTREYGDKSYVFENKHAESRIIRMSNKVAGGKAVNTTDFDLSDDEKIALFQNGIKAVQEKLADWNFSEYVAQFRSDAV